MAKNRPSKRVNLSEEIESDQREREEAEWNTENAPAEEAPRESDEWLDLNVSSNPLKLPGNQGRHDEDRKVLSGFRVLIVDDNRDNQIFLSILLRQAGAESELAGDGVEALEKALSKNPDAILMDIHMPRLDGFEATRQLRERGFMKPIVAVTALTTTEDREECLRAGCSDYLAKPIDSTHLVRTLAYHLGRRPHH